MVKLDANVKCKSAPQLSIGELAEAAGVSTRAVRYYEQHGLVSAQRTPAGHRRFTPETVERVKLIQRMYSAGLSSTSIRPLLPCMVDESQRSKLLIRELRHQRDRLIEQIRQQQETVRILNEVINEYDAQHLPEA